MEILGMPSYQTLEHSKGCYSSKWQCLCFVHISILGRQPSTSNPHTWDTIQKGHNRSQHSILAAIVRCIQQKTAADKLAVREFSAVNLLDFRLDAHV